MVAVAILVTSVLLASRLITIFLALSICDYLSQKPLGMQTVFDVMVKDLLWTLIIIDINSDALNIDWGLVWNENFAFCALVCQHFMGLILFNQLFSTFLIRYLSVFNGSLINEWNESYILFTSRFTIGMFSMMATCYEVVVNDYGTGPFYQSLTNADTATEAKHPIFLEVSFVVVFVFSIFVYLRIEWYKFKSKTMKDDPAMTEDFASTIQTNIGAIRTSTAIVIVIIILSACYLALPFFIEKNNVHLMRLYVHTLASILLMILIMIYVKKSPKVVEHIKKRFSVKKRTATVGISP